MDGGITVITPTYNRAYTLGNLYKSLQKQISTFTEWIIVDDGSTDNTKELVEAWQKECNSFQIIYIYQDNGGKHRAINKGIKQVSGDWAFIVDSDDELTKDAIETAEQWIVELEQEADADKFAAVAGLRATSNGKILGGYPRHKKGKQYIDAKNNERQKWHLGGDKAEIYKVDILKRYPFPSFDNEKFLPEGAVWNRIALDGYKVRWYPKVIYLCEYLDEGLTKDEKKWLNNFNGFTYTTKVSIMAFDRIYKMRSITKYIHYAKIKGMPRREIILELNISVVEYGVGVLINFLYCTIKGMPVKRKNKQICIEGKK
ncbi:MAG: glycosyltransferase family 2 protein [Butyrivibrio sp.]|nr:glycosyltransferase family 2 protein [Butyrivibrio sp.]